MAHVDLATIHNPTTGTAPPATWGDQIRDNDQYVFERGPYICTSATRPGAPFEGQLIYETDTDKTLQYSGSAWWTIGLVTAAATGFTPAIVQGATVTKTTVVSEWRIVSGVCEWWFHFTCSSAGTGSSAVTLGTPVTASGDSRTVGAGSIGDASASTIDTGVWYLATSSTISFFGSDSTTSFWGVTPTTALATSDSLTGHIRYLVAAAA